MNKTHVPGTARELDSVLTEHDVAYHGHDSPQISDPAYDALLAARDRLAGGDPPGLPDPSVHLQPVNHDTPMLSLTNVMEDGRLQPMLNRHQAGGDITLAPKLDGLALSLVYENRRLVHAATRGDGTTGENVTANIAHLPDIPLTLPAHTAPAGRLDIRGEAFLPPSAWEAYCRDTVAAGSDRPSNPRNAAAGAVRKKKAPMPDRLRHIRFRAYDWRGDRPATDSYANLLDAIPANTGIPAAHTARVSLPRDDLDEAVARFRAAIDPDLPSDGVVVQHDSLRTRESLGTNRRAPTFAFARKWATDTVTTLLKSIEVQCGRTGRLTPVAILEPVETDGVTITRATLHHPAYVTALDLAPGDHVEVERAGSVIPAVLAKAKDSPTRPPSVSTWSFPQHCPCQRRAPVDRSQVHARCPADEFCQSMQLQRVRHATRRDALDIRGLSHAKIEQLHKAFGITEIHELFDRFAGNSANHELSCLTGWGPTSAARLASTLEAARTQPLARWLYAVGIPDVGRTASAAIAEHAPSVNAILGLADSDRDLTAIQGVNILAATNFRTALRTGGSRRNAAQALADQLRIETPFATPCDGPLAGQVIVVTGSVPGFTRTEAQAFLRARGATTADRVTNATTLVLTGSNPGSKLDEANRRGIPMEDAAPFFSDPPPPSGRKENDMAKPSTPQSGQPLAGHNIVVTGTLKKYSRSTIEQEILHRGGSPQRAVSGTTTLLLIGERPGSKLRKARERNIPIIDEDTFERQYAVN